MSEMTERGGARQAARDPDGQQASSPSRDASPAKAGKAAGASAAGGSAAEGSTAEGSASKGSASKGSAPEGKAAGGKAEAGKADAGKAAAGKGQDGKPAGGRPAERRRERRWVPAAARWILLLIGLVTIIEGANPGFYEHYRLHRIGDLAPGTLVNLTRTADVIIGLLLVLLSDGLRRRKRRAFQAVVVL